MWIAFATTLNVSMRWLRGRPELALLFGAVGGPLAFYAGERLGAVTVHRPAGGTGGAVGWLGADHPGPGEPLPRAWTAMRLGEAMFQTILQAQHWTTA
jgi:hypothetical protein